VRVLITGAGGQLGHDLAAAYAEDEVVGLTHEELDVADEPAVWAAVRDHRPDVVIHAAAWTDVDGCEEDPDRAHRVNALGAWWVARACEAAGATMVMVSTDHVFDGATGHGGPRTRPYTEFDTPAPANAYGRSKAAGEVLVRRTLSAHHIVRTSWLCGAQGHNFVRTMLRVGREQGRARVVDDQVGSPTFTPDLADAIRDVSVSGRFGTWHRTNTGHCSWFDLAAATFEVAGLDVDLAPMPSSELQRPAPRPSYAVLSNAHAEAAGLLVLPDWRASLHRLVDTLEGPD